MSEKQKIPNEILFNENFSREEDQLDLAPFLKSNSRLGKYKTIEYCPIDASNI